MGIKKQAPSTLPSPCNEGLAEFSPLSAQAVDAGRALTKLGYLASSWQSEPSASLRAWILEGRSSSESATGGGGHHGIGRSSDLSFATGPFILFVLQCDADMRSLDIGYLGWAWVVP